MKKPAKKSKVSRSKNSKTLLSFSTNKTLTMLFVALGVATVGVALTFFARADKEFPTTANEVVVEYRREKPSVVVKDATQTEPAAQQSYVAQVLGDGTVECALEDQDVVLTTKLPAGQIKQVFDEVNTSGIRELPDQIFMGDDTENFLASYQSISVNSNQDPKSVVIFEGAERPDVFDRVARMIDQRCEKATERKTREELKKLKHDPGVESQQSALEKLFGTQTVSAATTAGYVQSVENDQLNRIVSHRATHGRSGLTTSGCMTAIARIHAKRMADRGSIYHNPNIAAEVDYACTKSNGYWTMLGENVGVGYDSASLFNAFLASSAHHANIDRSNWTHKAVGAYRTTDERIWVVQMYAECRGCGGPWNTAPSYVGDPAPPTNTPPKFYKWDTALPKHGVSADFNGDGQIDPAMWSKASANWYVKDQVTVTYGDGALKDIPIPGDYNGDKKADMAVWRQSNKTFYVRNIGAYAFGLTTDVPVPADYNGDGKTDIAVFRASNGTWYLRGLGTNGATWSYTFGQSQGDIPLPADYNGDNKADLGIFRSGKWYAKTMGGTYIINAGAYGTTGDIPVPGDYNGDKKADMAVWRPSNKVWYIKGIAEGTPAFGVTSGDVAAIADYDNNGKMNIGILRPAENTLYWRTIPQDSTTNQSAKVVN